jgi:lantibiotic modifying enzyme
VGHNLLAVISGADPDRYRGAARRAADWLAATAVEEDGGLTWPYRPGVSPETDSSLAWGAPGVTWFFIEHHLATGDARSLDMAVGGGKWLQAQLAQAGGTVEPGLFTGLAGFAVVFEALGRIGIDSQDDVQRVFELLVYRAQPTRDGVNWDDITEVLWGTAGIGFLLLSRGPAVIGSQALQLATQAGDWLLSVAHPARGGLRWDMGEGPARERPQLNHIWFPNFAHGTAGIAAFLARLGAATGEARFTDAALSASRWVLNTCRTEGNTCAAHHHDPPARPGDVGMGPPREDRDVSPLYTMGWCHGPPGLGWFFRELQLATGDAIWADWIARTGRAVRNSGIPERKEPGFWDNLGRCCGSAGVAEYFLDLHAWRSDPDHLAFALTLVDDILERAITDEKGMRWSNVEWRKTPPELPPETTLYQGAAGIGSTLLRVSRHLEGDRSVLRWPCAPDWTPDDLSSPLGARG